MNRYRHEYKYYLNSQQKAILLMKASAVLEHDPHVEQDGTYTIRSLYFDDLNNSCMMENESGTDPRSKFRIRYYNNDISRIQLEKKSKCRGMTLKESCPLTSEEVNDIIHGNFPSITNTTPHTKAKLISEMILRNLSPKVIVTYERIPFVYSAGNVRITFDNHITSSTQVNLFLSGDYSTRPIMAVGQSILEVKWDEILPLHIKNVLQLNELQWTSFSKYYMCRLFNI